MKHKNQDFDYIKINLASPTRIRGWAERILSNGHIVGEVLKSETINYRTFKPEIDGLFCEKIFGPIKSWECSCGKYKQTHDQGRVCELCGVELTESKVRRHRMGYVKLLTPIAHIWYLKSRPSYIAKVLNKPIEFIESIIYSNEIKKNKTKTFSETKLNTNKFLNLFNKEDEKKDIVNLEMNTQSETVWLHKLLQNIDIIKEIKDSRNELLKVIEIKNQFKGIKNNDDQSSQKNGIKIKKITTRIRILESFIATNSKPEWMILEILPIIPPGLRPMVRLDSGRFATSDINELYRRVITRNNRLKRLISIYAPDIVLRSEKRMLQEAVDSLIDNGKRDLKYKDMHNRVLRSLSKTIEGKQGRFRQNLLGKRVDYSGRSVIIVGPQLELHECGLPYELAIELYQSFLIHELINQNLAGTIRMAKKLIRQNNTFIWNLLKEIIKGHPVLLNRAPTLHRLGIQAFEPILVNDHAILLHPLVCSAFNADFDGDQMAVHLPLSLEAQIESRILLFSTNNILSPATGQPLIQPTQDMLLGCYYLTITNQVNAIGKNHYFSSFNDVLLAYKQNSINLHSFIWVRCSNSFNFSKTEINKNNRLKVLYINKEEKIEFYKNLQRKILINENKIIQQYIRTTPGRIIFNNSLNKILSSKKLKKN
ncbi:MAG: DNA-directed RNA polymerase subunit beta' [Alphaproteobacteria bacterium]|nr:DNA-directed RNA polymerase subunit beta' [Alphaproteobacteria bacterium]